MNDILRKPYTLSFFKNEDGLFSGKILEFPGCFAQGDTIDSALENLIKAAESWIEAAIDQGLIIPEPFESQTFGGRVALRLPKSLHKQVIKLAEMDGISLNQFLVDAIAEKVGAHNLYHYLSAQLSEKMASNMDVSLHQTYVQEKLTTSSTHSKFVAVKTVRENQNLIILEEDYARVH